MNDIILEHIGKSFGTNTVLEDFSHTFPGGRLTAIEGASGCGKTTLLNILAGFHQPDEGTITGLPSRISYVFQEDRLSEDFSVLSNIRLVTGKTRSRAEIEAHLKELSLEDALKKPVREWSGGMKRRAAIARAILYEADLYLFDEPFKGLDEALKKTVMDYVLKYTKGKTVILITHDKAEADYLGGELLTMKGKPREYRHSERHS